MTTRDLMIGDYITFTDCQNDDAPVIIEIVGLGYQGRGVEEEALVCINGDKGCDLMEIDEEFCGIPLTPEVLEKNGFVEHRDGFYATEQEQLAGDGFVVRNMVYYKSGILSVVTERGEIGIGIKFIHELQHALKLCGIEKQITL